MAVSIKQTSDVAAVITVQVSAADYQPQVDKALKNYQKNASIPGFRKGHAPLGLIKKQVGTSRSRRSTVLSSALSSAISTKRSSRSSAIPCP